MSVNPKVTTAALITDSLVFMTGEQRLTIALNLHELSCDIAREGIRQGHPEADAAEVERLLRRRLELTRTG